LLAGDIARCETPLENFECPEGTFEVA